MRSLVSSGSATSDAQKYRFNIISSARTSKRRLPIEAGDSPGNLALPAHARAKEHCAIDLYLRGIGSQHARGHEEERHESGRHTLNYPLSLQRRQLWARDGRHNESRLTSAFTGHPEMRVPRARTIVSRDANKRGRGSSAASKRCRPRNTAEL